MYSVELFKNQQNCVKLIKTTTMTIKKALNMNTFVHLLLIALHIHRVLISTYKTKISNF